MTRMLTIIDAFTNQPFRGNPAAVCLTETPPCDTWMQQVAQELNLSETAFLHPLVNGYSLRWFTPKVEVDLCGHATLASAHLLWQSGVLAIEEPIKFKTRSGWITCRKIGEWIEMDFPAVAVRPIAVPAGITDALGCDVIFAGSNGMDMLVEIADAKLLRSLAPHMELLGQLPMRGVIVTSESDDPRYDFLSRFFAPAVGVAEDPVTGSAHCALGPYWQQKVCRDQFTAYQASSRGGIVKLDVRGDRVFLSGQAVVMGRIDFLQ